ncbi:MULTISPECIES: pitrilysin family protein [Methylobacterium]|jgi:predicted Zn-dependent peptidase|uniref:M16 family metallopeptidase n=1 Tax=Methylobacterium TaxID=407 RepID=UPI0008EBEEED|nr:MULTISPECIES: pitrilysin family protein [Methylobacterium]MBK3398596.1 insulinase family protein [Methylobacterium ajmalii]MBK3409522.1 insulinase family protein [Methylobacterium ajmalii]MBK3423352.1 insulinase family protein [Methylobacterium ajmalii]MBZ6413186.1 insulinase family protein [Methylobacterium sp.]SFF43498.1 Predicted Zn-dependent peptidase [Methylobacterium sp. yr596]
MNQHFATLGASPDLKITRLANGLTVATEAMPGLATATLGVWVGAGSRNERPEEHGLSHLIEHMAFKGTATRSARQIAEDIENVGGEINAATSVEQTSYTARVLGEDAEVALDVLGDILTRSVFEAGELAREKGVILQEYAAVEDTPDDVVYDAFTEAAFPDQPIGRPILGRPETIQSFDRAAIEAYLAREYTPGRMVLAAAGAVEHDAIVAAAEKHFGAMPASEAPEAVPGQYRGGERRMKRKLEQANLVLGLPGLSFRDDKYYATHLFAQVLGGGLTSRLWHEVRETRGLAYEIHAFHWPFSDCGLFGIGAGTAGADLPGLVDVTLACLRDAADTVDEAELARAKAQLKVALLSALETPGGRIERTARQLLAWGRVIPAAEVIAKVDAVTTDDVRAAGRALIAGAPTLAAIGPIKTLQSLDAVGKALRGA